MSKVRVYEVAKQLNMDQKQLVAAFQSMGIGDVRNHMSAVEVDVVERLKRQLERQKTPEVVEERIRPGVIKRKAKATEAEVPSAKPSVRELGAQVPISKPSTPSRADESARDEVLLRTSREVAPLAKPSTREVEDIPEPPVARRSVPRAQPSGAGQPSGAEIRSTESPSAKPSASSRASASVKGAASAEGAAPATSTKLEGAVAPVSSRGRAAAAGASAGAESLPISSLGRKSARGEVKPSKSATPSKSGAKAKPSSDLDFGEDGGGNVVLPPPSAPAAELHRLSSEPAPASAEPASTVPASTVPAATVQVATETSAKVETPKSQSVEAAPIGVAGTESGVRNAPVKRDAPPASSTLGGPSSVAPPSTLSSPPPADAPRRPSTPPRTGIDVWQGRPGVPMPQTRSTAPAARRTTYDPRAASSPARPMGGPPSGFPQGGNRGPQGRHNQRPQFGQRGRMGMTSSASKRPPTMMEMAAHKKVIKIEESVSLQKLAGMMSLKVTDVLLKLLGMGMTGVNINSTIDADTAKILASEFGWTVEDVAISEEQTLEAAMGLTDKTEYALEARPPIVTVMGHVDHGKTSLLDRIRKATVAAGEAGGITQHIGAYRVETHKGTLAFLDTPGHEAFTAMRARGAQVTDIVVLVVAADDGVMPQTREAISHAQSAKVPIIVAVNKIDKPSADPDRVKRDLAGLGLTPEEWGGETLYVHVSALTGEGVDILLDSILLQAEVLELNASPKRRAHGVVIEALLDRGRGPVARVMVQDGTLRTGDILIAGPAWGKVRAMTDEFGRSLSQAGPATPVEVLGLNEVPSAGDPVHAVKDAKTAEEIAEQRRKKQNTSLIPKDVRNTLESIVDRLKEGEQLEMKLIIKGDVQGSVEAVGQALAKLTTPKVKVTIVHAGVGAITEGDVNLAIASKAIITGFNVRPAGKASSLAEGGGIEIRLYNIIYNAVDDIRAAMEGLLPTTKIEKALGKAEIRKVFKITKVGAIAGSYVTSGSVKRGAEMRLVRDGSVVHSGKISSLKRIKDDVKEVPEGMECGISLEAFQDMKEGDIIEAFEIEEVKQKL